VSTKTAPRLHVRPSVFGDWLFYCFAYESVNVTNYPNLSATINRGCCVGAIGNSLPGRGIQRMKRVTLQTHLAE
jgi:hypothetical protein